MAWAFGTRSLAVCLCSSSKVKEVGLAWLAATPKLSPSFYSDVPGSGYTTGLGYYYAGESEMLSSSVSTS